MLFFIICCDFYYTCRRLWTTSRFIPTGPEIERFRSQIFTALLPTINFYYFKYIFCLNCSFCLKCFSVLRSVLSIHTSYIFLFTYYVYNFNRVLIIFSKTNSQNFEMTFKQKCSKNIRLLDRSQTVQTVLSSRYELVFFKSLINYYNPCKNLITVLVE